MRRALLMAMCLLAVSLSGWAAGQFSLVTPTWVAENSGNPGIRILDVRSDLTAYYNGHVLNAVHFPADSLRGPREGLPAQYLPTELQCELLARAGVAPGQTVVLYADGANVVNAAMVAYVLEKIGVESTAIMDGGWEGYTAAKLPVTQLYPVYQSRPLRAQVNAEISVNLEQVQGAILDPSIKFIDARAPAAYAGEVKIWQRNGHIPGAINVPWQTLMDPANPHKFKRAAEVQAIFDAKGIEKTDEIIVYCGTSREASLEFLALRHVLGYPHVRLYEGSWAEYCSHLLMPVESGRQ
jgi:thiosulfate/3-mercaptopyruvate sulfurtransferase